MEAKYLRVVLATFFAVKGDPIHTTHQTIQHTK